MQIKATLTPGQNGTKQLLKECGDQLVCVRYRQEKARQRRIKIIEPIIDEQDRIPGVTMQADRRAAVKIGYHETELREQIKQAGGFWNIRKKVWILSCYKVLQMGLEHRMIDEETGLSFLDV